MRTGALRLRGHAHVVADSGSYVGSISGVNDVNKRRFRPTRNAICQHVYAMNAVNNVLPVAVTRSAKQRPRWPSRLPGAHEANRRERQSSEAR